MKYAAVLFDLDGTLVNTLEDLAASVNQALAQLSLPGHSVDSFRFKVGNGSRMMVSRSLPAQRQDLIETVLQLQQAYYREHLCDHSGPYPGVGEMVGALQNRGFKLAVLSNKPDEATRQIIAACFAPGVFEVVAGNRADLPLKPDPAAALWVAGQLGVAASRIAYLGDTGTDMQTATRAGMFAIGAAWGFRDREELLQNGAQAIIERPEQLPDLLDEGAD